MLTKFKPTFIKDITSLPSEIRKKVEEFAFVSLPGCKHLGELSGIKKIHGAKSHYRFRINDYRVGFELRGEEVIIYRVLHRSKIYRYFP
jgi:mRNA-degrading endonuclease RelE of RelBE toxin-antitoxin system